MKINKYISVDEEIFHRLTRETNASDLINELLKSHYNTKNQDNIEILKQKISEIKQINKENRKKEKEMINKLLKINEKNKALSQNYSSGFPEELIKMLKNIDNLDYESAVMISKKFNLHRRSMGGIKLIKLWEEIKNNVV